MSPVQQYPKKRTSCASCVANVLQKAGLSTTRAPWFCSTFPVARSIRLELANNLPLPPGALQELEFTLLSPATHTDGPTPSLAHKSWMAPQRWQLCEEPFDPLSSAKVKLGQYIPPRQQPPSGSSLQPFKRKPACSCSAEDGLYYQLLLVIKTCDTSLRIFLDSK